MRERKKFFVNNRLNKGYRKRFDTELSDIEAFKKQNVHLLPPIEVIEQYESHYPGIFKKLMEMSQKEQQNRHLLAALEIEKAAKMSSYGRIAGLLYIIIISLSVTNLTLNGYPIIAGLFTLAGFSCMYFVAYYCKNNTFPRNDRRKFIHYKSRTN